MTTAQNRAAHIRLLVLDVDGILTDGRIYYGNNGEELKAFNIKDGLGMTVADGSATVREAADWVSSLNGGCGAVREACEFILSARGEWSSVAAGFA